MAAVLIAVPRARAQAIDKAVLNSTVMITAEVDPGKLPAGRQRPGGPLVSHGTGFLLFRGLGYIKGQVFLVTNKHILPKEGAPKAIKVRVIVHDNEGASRVEDVSIPIVGEDGKYLDSVRMHPDPDTDVAAINIATTAFGSRFELLIDAITTGKRLDTSMLLSTDQLASAKIGVGSQVYVLGFPAALFDPRNVSPVLRVGVISTDPREGYTFNDELRQTTGLPSHINGFLIDSNVYPGSSGSLVIAVPDSQSQSTPAPGSKARAKANAPRADAWKPHIIGIVAGSIPIFDAPLRSFERIGLGIVYSAETIREVLQEFERGVTSQR
jgi:hypothetical protein